VLLGVNLIFTTKHGTGRSNYTVDTAHWRFQYARGGFEPERVAFEGDSERFRQDAALLIVAAPVEE